MMEATTKSQRKSLSALITIIVLWRDGAVDQKTTYSEYHNLVNFPLDTPGWESVKNLLQRTDLTKWLSLIADGVGTLKTTEREVIVANVVQPKVSYVPAITPRVAAPVKDTKTGEDLFERILLLKVLYLNGRVDGLDYEAYFETVGADRSVSKLCFSRICTTVEDMKRSVLESEVYSGLASVGMTEGELIKGQFQSHY